MNHLEVAIHYLGAAAANAGGFQPQRAVYFLDIGCNAPCGKHAVQPGSLGLFHYTEAVLCQLFI